MEWHLAVSVTGGDVLVPRRGRVGSLRRLDRIMVGRHVRVTPRRMVHLNGVYHWRRSVLRTVPS